MPSSHLVFRVHSTQPDIQRLKERHIMTRRSVVELQPKLPIMPYINHSQADAEDIAQHQNAISMEGQVRPSYRRIYSSGLGIPVRLHSYQKRANKYTIIKASLLIPGADDPIPNGALVIEGRTIAWVGPQSSLPSEYSSTQHRSIEVPYLMPGLWDAHTHFDGESQTLAEGAGANYVGFIAEHPTAAGARLAKGCWEALQRGYTSLRDVAGYGCEISRAIDDGTIIGPNIYSSGSCLSQTAGHGDVFPLPAGDVLLNMGVSSIKPGQFGTGVAMLVDGADECRRAVRLQIRRGARVIKVMASGGVMSRDDDPRFAQFSPEELTTIVDEAARQGRVVAAHVHGKPGILAAVKAGVRTVEHVSFADEECLELIKEKGVVYVATRTVIDLLLASQGKGLPKENWDKVKLVADDHLRAYKQAIEKKISIALGTDTPPGFNMAKELEHAVECGMTNLEAIKSATANGPLTVGDQAPLTGQLKAGYEADIIAVAENPTKDVRVLQCPENITWVWKGGKVFKGPGVPPWGEGYALENFDCLFESSHKPDEPFEYTYCE